MITRKKQELYTAMQIFKHDDIVTFRIYAQVKPLPKQIGMLHDIYDLKIQIVPPYACFINHLHIRDFPNLKTAYSILLERVRSLCQQFGFKVPYRELWKWQREKEG